MEDCNDSVFNMNSNIQRIAFLITENWNKITIQTRRNCFDNLIKDFPKFNQKYFYLSLKNV